MEKIKVHVEYEQKASRLELLVRLVYWIPLVVVYYALAFLFLISTLFTWLGILILGRRFKTPVGLLHHFARYVTKLALYLSGAVDERPPIIPEKE